MVIDQIAKQRVTEVLEQKKSGIQVCQVNFWGVQAGSVQTGRDIHEGRRVFEMRR